MKTIAVIGAGSRGMTYARLIQRSGRARVIAVAEIQPDRLERAQRELDIAPEGLFDHSDKLLSREKLADVAIIATQDRDHYGMAVKALELGYDLLLEKPVSPDPRECLHISRLAQEKGRRVAVCHVLRYSPYFRAIKQIIDSGEVGRVIDIQHNENIGNFHMAHSFVRGSWRNLAESSPILLAKSCHDLDLLVWLAGSRCKRIASFGDLAYFKPENAPEGSTERCLDCPAATECRYDVRKAYLQHLGAWPTTALTLDQTEEGVTHALREGPYGRCVFRCDNDVCDHQVTLLEFENGIKATFNLSAFTNRVARTMKIMCEHGEIRCNEHMNIIEVVSFASHGNERGNSRLIEVEKTVGGHSGGDGGIVNALLNMLEGVSGGMDTDIAHSVESHLMVGAAEKSRLEHVMVNMEEYRKSLA